MAILIIALGGLAVSAWWFPRWRAHRRAMNERNASTTLKTLTSAEADFRANDRDGNGVNDFWTGDLEGLYRLGLIERGVAEADSSPLNPLVPQPIPYRGYYYEALRLDNSTTPPTAYAQDTDKTSGKVHNLERFGFVAYPADSGGGKYYYMINENNSIFRAAATIPRPTNWFSDNERRPFWGMID
ncbi:MAG TPA: DUF2950 family protein [Planctomycetota bacterium]|nr:DUF2950 family protein [Planctomycetota bacterium]